MCFSFESQYCVGYQWQIPFFVSGCVFPCTVDLRPATHKYELGRFMDGYALYYASGDVSFQHSCDIDWSHATLMNAVLTKRWILELAMMYQPGS